MAGGESKGHRQLKRGTFLWAQSHGYTACAEEVRLPNSGYRADVVGYKPGVRGELGTTVVFECKWARSDFLGDSGQVEESMERLRELKQRREVLEKNLRTHHPHLQSGETLFPEYDVIDFDKLEHAAYQAVIREIRIVQSRIQGGSKFDRVARYRSADLCYLVVRRGICQPEEFPPGWGILEWDEVEVIDLPENIEGGCEPVPALSLVNRPERRDCGDRPRVELLQRIAEAGTRLGNRRFEIPGQLPFVERRKRANF